MKALGEKWRNLPQNTRDAYSARALALVEQYKQQKQAFEEDLEKQGLLEVN